MANKQFLEKAYLAYFGRQWTLRFALLKTTERSRGQVAFFHLNQKLCMATLLVAIQISTVTTCSLAAMLNRRRPDVG
jgi:hypothetical protein